VRTLRAKINKFVNFCQFFCQIARITPGFCAYFHLSTYSFMIYKAVLKISAGLQLSIIPMSLGSPWLSRISRNLTPFIDQIFYSDAIHIW